MIKQTKGKIFLAAERGINETAWLRSYNTFNFGKYQHEHKQPVGDMYVLNDDTLAGRKSLRMLIGEDSYVIILPVHGAVETNNSLAVAGQAQLVNAQRGTKIGFCNPFGKDPINFLQVWIKSGAGKINSATQTFTYPDVNDHINRLVPVFSDTEGQLPFVFSIGKFSGRGETVYQKKQSNSFLFVFVLEGAFEVEGRLLHARDGLALYDAEEADMEALSAGAIILLIEQPLTGLPV